MNAETVSISELKAFAENSNEEQICSEIVSLIGLKCRPEQEVRDLASKMLDGISTARLAVHFRMLIELLHSPYSLLSYEVERLIDKINPELLEKEFDYLMELRNSSDHVVYRVVRNLLPRIAMTLSLKKKEVNYNLILEWQHSSEKKVVELANFMALQVMSPWSGLSLGPYLPFLKKCTDLDNNDFGTSELAATLAFKYLSVAPMTALFLNLDYITSFNNFGNKELRRSFRHLALESLKYVDSSELYKYGLFLFKCSEGKDKNDHKIAWKLLSKIKPDDLPVCELVYCQACGLYRVRHAGKVLVKTVNEEKLAEHIEELLHMQNSDCYEVRYLAMKLLFKISKQQIAEKKEVLEKYLDFRSPMVSTVAETLLSRSHC